MTTLINDVKTVEDNFVNAMGSGVAAAKHLATLIDTCVNGGVFDTRSIAIVVNRLDKKSDANGSRAVRQIFAAIFTGATFAKSKDKKSIVLKLKDKMVDESALDRLAEGVTGGLSIRSTLVKHVKGDTDKAPVELPKWAASQIKRMEKEGFSRAALIAALQGVSETEVAF